MLSCTKKRVGAMHTWPALRNLAAPADFTARAMSAIRSFNTLDEAITEANRLAFGLAGYAFTRSLKNADLLARRVEVGMLWMNMPALPSAEMPFGGIKDSGYGSEGGPEAMDAYLNARAVTIMNV